MSVVLGRWHARLGQLPPVCAREAGPLTFLTNRRELGTINTRTGGRWTHAHNKCAKMAPACSKCQISFGTGPGECSDSRLYILRECCNCHWDGEHERAYFDECGCHVCKMLRKSWKGCTTLVKYQKSEEKRKAETEEKRKAEEENKRKEEEEKRKAEEEKKRKARRKSARPRRRKRARPKRRRSDHVLLVQLSEMGFRDCDTNATLLRKCGNDMTTVIEQLVVIEPPTVGQQGTRGGDRIEDSARESSGSSSAAGGDRVVSGFNSQVELDHTRCSIDSKVLGRGSSADVRGGIYRFPGHDSNTRVAFKFLRNGLQLPTDMRKKIMDELAFGVQLKHSNLVPMYGVIEDLQRGPALVLELCPGGSLRSALDDS